MIPAALALAALLALAGCITIPDETSAETFERASAPREERISGMTASETRQDREVACSSGGIQIPPRACAERDLVVTGRIGVDRLPIDLSAANGAVAIVPSQGDTWRFEATYRVSELTQERANAALDTAWTWSHEENGQHRLRAGPTPTGASLSIGSGVQVATYRLELPTWVEIDLDAETDNGQIAVAGFQMGDVRVASDNGAIRLDGAARNVDATTDNGQIVLTLTPRGGAFEATADNGQIIVRVPAGRAYGYDVQAETDNGRVDIQLPDGESRRTENGETFRTRGYDTRPVRTTMAFLTDNGQIVVTGR